AGFGFDSRSAACRYGAGGMDRSGRDVSFLAERITIARPALCGGFPGSAMSEAFADCLPAADASAAAPAKARTATTTVTRGRRDIRRTNSFNCLGTGFFPGVERSDRSTGPDIGRAH